MTLSLLTTDRDILQMSAVENLIGLAPTVVDQTSEGHRRLRLFLKFGSWLVIGTALGSVVGWIAAGMWINAAYDLTAVVIGGLILVLVKSDHLTIAAHLFVSYCLVYIFGMALLFDGPSEPVPRTTHFWYLPILVGLNLLLLDARGISRFVYAALCVTGFGLVQFDPFHIQTLYPLPLALRAWLNPVVLGAAVLAILFLMKLYVTDIVKAEERLIGANLKLDSLLHQLANTSHALATANRHKSEFLANMSHELRTPLNAIIGFSEVLNQRYFGDLNDKQTEYVKDINSSGKHLLSLINDILDLSKIEAGRTELNVTAFSLVQAMENILILVKERASRQGVKLILEIDDGVDDFRGDERKIKQIVLNLLTNAIKFTPSGGNVKVTLSAIEDRVQIDVIDTGVGIAPADQTIVFEAFRQVGSDYTTKAEGTGLGLTLTRNLVELHGGRIDLESVVGRGTTFSVVLPSVR